VLLVRPGEGCGEGRGRRVWAVPLQAERPIKGDPRRRRPGWGPGRHCAAIGSAAQQILKRGPGHADQLQLGHPQRHARPQHRRATGDERPARVRDPVAHHAPGACLVGQQRGSIAGAAGEVDHDDLVRFARDRAGLCRARVVDEGGLQPAQMTGERLRDGTGGGVGHDGEVHLTERVCGFEQFQLGGEGPPGRRGRAERGGNLRAGGAQGVRGQGDRLAGAVQ
jgi:hypothetical protein